MMDSINLVYEPECSTRDMDANKFNNIQNQFKEKCLGFDTCTLDVDEEMFTDECLAKFPERINAFDQTAINEWVASSNVTSSSAYFQLYIITECRGKALQIGGQNAGGGIYNKEQMGYYVVIFDFFISAIFLASLWIIQYLLRIDNDKYTYSTFEVQEFTIEVTNLPQTGSHYPITAL